MYTDDQPTDFFDLAIVRDFAQKNMSHPYHWTIVKTMFHHANVLDPDRRGPGALSAARYTMLTSAEIKRIGKAFANLREAFGDDMGLAVHCLNEYDLPSAVGIAKATAAIDPVWIEDPMTPYYADSWKALRQQSPIKILTGEKLEMPKQFLPFLQNEVLDIIQPDLAYAGGFTGCKKIADLASLYHVPMNLHNYGTAVLHMASLHFAASIFDFYACESFVGKPKMESSNGGAAVCQQVSASQRCPQRASRGPGAWHRTQSGRDKGRLGTRRNLVGMTAYGRKLDLPDRAVLRHRRLRMPSPPRTPFGGEPHLAISGFGDTDSGPALATPRRHGA